MKKKSKIPDRRSRHGREMFLLLLSGVLLFQWGKIDAFAAAKEIKTVNIRVTSKLEVGSKLPDIKLETTTVSDGEVAVDASGGKYSVSEAEWTETPTSTWDVALSSSVLPPLSSAMRFSPGSPRILPSSF